MNTARIAGFFRVLVSFLLALVVFYIAFSWTASCRIERERARAEMATEAGGARK